MMDPLQYPSLVPFYFDVTYSSQLDVFVHQSSSTVSLDRNACPWARIIEGSRFSADFLHLPSIADILRIYSSQDLY